MAKIEITLKTYSDNSYKAQSLLENKYNYNNYQLEP